MTHQTVLIDGIAIPRLIYGTAWKEEQTQRLTELAIRHGFRGIDTANQRRHYHESAVGQAIQTSIAGGMVTREDLFLQTKFTFRRGQDHRLPYDPAASIAIQVEQSFASSLEHLGVENIDCLLLHGPETSNGLTPDDRAAWRSIEAIYDRGLTRLIGVSNVSLEQLELFCQDACIQPHVVQNRCYAARAWDRPVREFCVAKGLVYQGFSLLTANRATLASPLISRIAKRHARTPAQITFRFALEVGMTALTGTTNVDHMQADLDIFDFSLDQDEIEEVKCLTKT
ncbi:MAG: aldo/keto reductase [Fuerstiella sp.]|nr:aldo/keto reductase [Fuerstiella sp.]